MLNIVSCPFIIKKNRFVYLHICSISTSESYSPLVVDKRRVRERRSLTQAEVKGQGGGLCCCRDRTTAGPR